MLKLEGSWIRIKQQLRFVERIAFTLDEEHRLFQDEILQLLAIKLSLARASLEKVIKKNEGTPSRLAFIKVKRGKYVVERVTLNTVILDLEDWQRRFDPSWFLIILIANPIIDEQLAEQNAEQKQAQSSSTSRGAGSAQSASAKDNKQSPLALASNLRDALRPKPRREMSIFLPMLDTPTISIPFSNAKVAQRGAQWFVIDRYICQTGRSISEQNNDVRKLAQKLASVDPWIFGLLSCKGVVKVVDHQRQQTGSFDFVFRVPASKEIIQSLRQSLLSGEMYYSLSRRILMAKELAKSVGYVHNLNFVHKNICPETVLLFQDLESNFSTFLVGFNNFRAADGGTNFAGDTQWDRNLYRHPSRQGEFPEEKYRMQHDVYSLGVCLLEIGLWESFVSYSSESIPRPQTGEFYRQFTKWLEGMGAANSPQVANSLWYQEVIARSLKDYFVYLAKTRLPIAMGDKYSSVVVTCLTCLDEDNDDFGTEEEMADKEGILVAVRFMETILQKLNEISV